MASACSVPSSPSPSTTSRVFPFARAAANSSPPATRAPSGDVADYTAPYYVASVVTGATIVNKQMLAVAFSFAPGEATTTFSQSVPSTVIRLDNGKKPNESGLLVGLQLTREQLDYNKKSGRFAP